jgi:23S rRNA pseudouridine1911/1915/1917 synthase
LKQTEMIISSALETTEADEGEDIVGEVEWRNVKMSADQHGLRLDRALVDVVPEFSRSYLQQLIEAGCVSLRDQIVRKASQRIHVGDALRIELRPTPQSQAFKPEAMPLSVVYSDPHMYIIDKPAGLVVHPAPGNWSGTLLNGLLALDPASAAVPRAGIVHRLDKDTSGLMVVARTRQAMDVLVAAIAAREVSRQYLAVGQQHWTGPEKVTVDAPIGRDPRNRLRMAVVDLQSTSGKTAKTDLVLLDSVPQGCLVRCILHTGRTHQIRVHMASVGHPLVADATYGGTAVPAMGRQALHACRLALKHPVDGSALVFESPLPADFLQLLAAWGLRYNSPQGL